MAQLKSGSQMGGQAIAVTAQIPAADHGINSGNAGAQVGDVAMGPYNAQGVNVDQTAAAGNISAGSCYDGSFTNNGSFVYNSYAVQSSQTQDPVQAGTWRNLGPGRGFYAQFSPSECPTYGWRNALLWVRTA